MSRDWSDLKLSLLARVRADAPRKVWTPTDFVDLASRDAVDKALQRLTKAGTLRRIDRGLYDQPGSNKLTQQPNPPDPRSVIDAVGRRDQARMLVDGMTAANDLGLTDAVTAKITVHTDARRRPIQLGNVTIIFRPTAASKLFWAGRPAMRVVQALHWLRDVLARNTESSLIELKLAKLFDDPNVGPPLKADLAAGMSALPTWMREFLEPMIKAGPGARRRHLEYVEEVGAAGSHHNRARRSSDATDPHDIDAVQSETKPSSTRKKQTGKSRSTRVAKS